MDKLDIGNKLIVIGLILYIGAVPLYIISAMIWEITPIGFIIDCILIITGLTCIIMGGNWAKKSRDYWLVLIGLILILGGLFLEAINISANISGIFIYIPYPTSTVLLIIGITLAIIGGLMKE
ncbi:MAG: hypothetical protein ACFE9Q_06470 [Candidatus Hodarchaeota archaeon]